MNKVIIISGAGISAESGLETYRDDNGIWKQYDINEVLTKGCEFNPKSIEFLNECRKKFKNSQPNTIHLELAKLEKTYGSNRVILYTQNIDDLFEKANCEKVFHVHGKLSELKCVNCKQIIDIGEELLTDQKCIKFISDKVCKTGAFIKCDTPYRTNVVMFGESGYFYKSMYGEIFDLTSDDILLVIGTSCTVLKVDEFALYTKCYKILCNKEEIKTINTKQYDNIFYGDGTKNINTIIDIIKSKLK
jgi:NAD-dependent deacetylase